MRTAKIILLLTLAAPGIHAQAPPLTSWDNPPLVDVTLTLKGRPGRSYTQIEKTARGDMKVTLESTDETNTTKGTILFISGRWMVAQGLELDPGYEIDTMDAAALEAQIVQRLLASAIPAGPASINGRQSVSKEETKLSIELATASATGGFAPPWKVTGSVEKTAPSRVTYALDFTFRGETGVEQTMHLEGYVANPPSPLELPDTVSLAGWNVYPVGPQLRPKGAVKFSTLGDLRNAK